MPWRRSSNGPCEPTPCASALGVGPLPGRLRVFSCEKGEKPPAVWPGCYRGEGIEHMVCDTGRAAGGKRAVATALADR